MLGTSFLPSFLHFLPSFTSFLPSLPSFLHFLPSFTSFLPSLPSFLHFLPSFTSFLPSLPSFLHFASVAGIYNQELALLHYHHHDTNHPSIQIHHARSRSRHPLRQQLHHRRIRPHPAHQPLRPLLHHPRRRAAHAAGLIHPLHDVRHSHQTPPLRLGLLRLESHDHRHGDRPRAPAGANGNPRQCCRGGFDVHAFRDDGGV